MGCGASSPTTPVKPTAVATAEDPTNLSKPEPVVNSGPKGYHGDIDHLNDYLGLKTQFNYIQETEVARDTACSVFADVQVEELDDALTTKVLSEARTKWLELDVNKNGMLDFDELAPLWEWVFKQFCRTFSSQEEEAAAVDEQLRRFLRNTPPKEGAGKWTYDEFADYFAAIVAEADQYQLKRNQTFADHLDKSAAAAKFAELDKDGSQFLEKKEVESLAEWVFSSFRPGGKPMAPELKAIEAAHLLKKLDAAAGNSDGKISFAEFEGYFNEKIGQIAKFEARVNGSHKT